MVYPVGIRLGVGPYGTAATPDHRSMRPSVQMYLTIFLPHEQT